MKISLRWVSRFVDLEDLTADRIREDLTMSTAEIEDVETFGAGLEELVVGHVVECGQHPNADRLSLARVDVGAGELLGIVCGAPNVAEGQRVAVVTAGKTLPGGTRVEKARIRGETSQGMICSERELGLSDEHEGIMVLETAAAPGTPLLDALPVRDDVLDIDNKSVNHRPDLWGHYGFARELAAIYGRPLRPACTRQRLPARGRSVPIRIDDLDDCPRFCGVVIEGVGAARSPEWMRWLLRAVGQRPIDLLVDLTNFVMLELGQPMHAFDLRRLDASGIHVRRARDGEVLKTLDGVERRLGADDIVVASGERVVSLAGIMGGADSMVDADTTELLLEAANWHPARIRRTGKRLGLRSDASTRFEKSLDPAGAEESIHRYLELLGELRPQARAAGPLVDPSGWTYRPRHVLLRRERLALKLGVAIEDAEVRRILESLQFDVAPAPEGFGVGVPSFRATKDVEIEDDLIEEVGRMFRYDNIPGQPLQSIVTVPPRSEDLLLVRELIRIAATEIGCNEVYDYSFAPDALLAAVNAPDLDYVRIRNPVAPDLARMRRNVLPSLLGCVAGNLREQAEVRVVEQGKGYHPERRDAHGLPEEVFEVALVWSRREGEHPYPELRSRVESMLSRVGYPAVLEERFADETLPWLHPGKTVGIARDGAGAGYVGWLHPAVCRNLGIPPTTAIASVDVRALLASGRDAKTYVPIPRFPSQPVDVALLVDDSARAGAVAGFLREAGGELVRAVELFEVYRGTGLPVGRKSLNFTVTLGADDRTLTARDEEEYLDRVRQRAGEVGAELRG